MARADAWTHEERNVANTGMSLSMIESDCSSKVNVFLPNVKVQLSRKSLNKICEIFHMESLAKQKYVR